ncbi:MAG: phage holin family protein [Bacteroidota bacterium]
MVTFLKTTLIFLMVIFTPIKGLLLITGISVLLDTFFAVFATIKLNGWKSYQSTKLFNIVVKTFFYLGSIILAYFVDKYIIQKDYILGVELLMSKAITIFWIYIEVKSIDETSQKLGNEPFYKMIKNIINTTKDLKKDINEIRE